jgi:hypothetical protein
VLKERSATFATVAAIDFISSRRRVFWPIFFPSKFERNGRERSSGNAMQISRQRGFVPGGRPAKQLRFLENIEGRSTMSGLQKNYERWGKEMGAMFNIEIGHEPARQRFQSSCFPL